MKDPLRFRRSKAGATGEKIGISIVVNHTACDQLRTSQWSEQDGRLNSIGYRSKLQ